MRIEIQGVGFVNKGAELLLRTAVDEVRARSPESILAMDIKCGDYVKRANLGIYNIMPAHGKRDMARRVRDSIIVALMKRLFGSYGIVDVDDLDGVIDLAGYAYGDAWGVHPSIRLLEKSKKIKRKGKSFVLLPQALGPFANTEVRNAFLQASQYLDFIYARDSVSYEHLLDLGLDASKIGLAPDITLFRKKELYCSLPETEEAKAPVAAVVPNTRMLDKGGDFWASNYIDIVRKVLKHLLDIGYFVYVVQHDMTLSDSQTIDSLLNGVDNNRVAVLKEQDPDMLKNILSKMYLVVGSRYHALASSLSSGVPVVALGWSHKYPMLLKDFGCEEMCFTSECAADDVLARVDQLASQAENAEYRMRIEQNYSKMYKINNDMWKNVLRIIERK